MFWKRSGTGRKRDGGQISPRLSALLGSCVRGTGPSRVVEDAATTDTAGSSVPGVAPQAVADDRGSAAVRGSVPHRAAARGLALVPSRSDSAAGFGAPRQVGRAGTVEATGDGKMPVASWSRGQQQALAIRGFEPTDAADTMQYENGGTALAMVQNVPQRRTRVPLKDVRVDAKIVDVVAKMTVQQTYYNEEPNPIEVVYVFPLDNKAAVCQFSIRIDDHVVHGGMEDRPAAQETYQYAISEGHGAYLLEQPMPDVFQISIGNLAPGEQADVTIAYLKFGDGDPDEAEFPIPTWFSPRSRQSTSSVAFLAVDERPEERKPVGRMLTRKVPLAPAPGDYFCFGASVGPRFSKGAENTPPESESEEEAERVRPPVPAIKSRELSLGLGGHDAEKQQPEPVQVKSRVADSSATLLITGGKGSVHASASSESQAVVETVVAEAVADAVAKVKAGGSADAEAEAVARAVGSAAATAVADATVSVNIDGQGEGHGLAEADARAVARVVTRAIAKAFAVAVGTNVYAQGVGRAVVSETRVARAVANASAEASSKGGSAEAASTVVAEAVVEVVAEAIAKALSSVEDHYATAQANADAMVDATDEQVLVDTFDEAAVTGESQATGQGTGDASTSVLPEAVEARKATSGVGDVMPGGGDEWPVTKETSGLEIGLQPSVPPPPKKTSSLPIGQQPSVPPVKQTAGLPIGPQPTAGQSGVKTSSSLPIGAQPTFGTKQTSGLQILPQTGQSTGGEGTGEFEFRPTPPGWPTGGVENGTMRPVLPIRKETSGFDFRPQPDGWPSRPTLSGAGKGEFRRPGAKTTANLPIRPQSTGWATRPTTGGSEDRPSAKTSSNLQIGPQRPAWSTGRTSWQSNQNGRESGAWQSPRPSKMASSFQGSGHRLSTKQGSGQGSYSKPAYSAKTTSNFIIQRRGLESVSSPRQVAKDPVRTILDLQDVDGCFKLTQELADALGFDLEDALLEYNVFRASLGEDGLTRTTGAEPWAIALVLQTFELKMLDRKSDWQIPAFKASDLLAVRLGEEEFHAILSCARMYLFRLEKINAIQE